MASCSCCPAWRCRASPAAWSWHDRVWWGYRAGATGAGWPGHDAAASGAAPPGHPGVSGQGRDQGVPVTAEDHPLSAVGEGGLPYTLTVSWHSGAWCRLLQDCSSRSVCSHSRRPLDEINGSDLVAFLVSQLPTVGVRWHERG